MEVELGLVVLSASDGGSKSCWEKLKLSFVIFIPLSTYSRQPWHGNVHMRWPVHRSCVQVTKSFPGLDCTFPSIDRLKASFPTVWWLGRNDIWGYVSVWL